MILRKKMKLIEEQTSPLFRIMWVFNSEDPARRSFTNNICAFHVGQGTILSVAHNLKSGPGFFHTIDNNYFINTLLPQISPNLKPIFESCYILDQNTNKRYFQNSRVDIGQIILNEFARLNVDTRWITQTAAGHCTPFLVIQFSNSDFYNDTTLTSLFSPTRHFAETSLNRHTFLIELELADAFYSNDVAVYKIVNTDQRIINKLPKIKTNFNLLDSSQTLVCLQSAPSSELGRLANEAKIEGHLEHWNAFVDRFGGNYIMDGLRYLIRGYFRFGSSGAPYVIYNESIDEFEVAAIQSEASPIQLSIGGNKEGNFQYVSAIASPLLNVKNELEQYL